MVSMIFMHLLASIMILSFSSWDSAASLLEAIYPIFVEREDVLGHQLEQLLLVGVNKQVDEAVHVSHLGHWVAGLVAGARGVRGTWTSRREGAATRHLSAGTRAPGITARGATVRFAVATSIIAAVEAETAAIVWVCQCDNVSAQSGLPGAADTKSSRLPSGVSAGRSGAAREQPANRVGQLFHPSQHSRPRGALTPSSHSQRDVEASSAKSG